MGNIAKSWAIPKFDIKDPSLVLYAPLWRPDMVANGGAIVNGTGTITTSPTGLAVGANTIDVAVAGTLIVTMPEGGSVASGTMTVTGSTVTVLAGIATTITTTGAIGNITVTPSNIIRSKDKNNQALTVTGALWTPQGRTFDGTDDVILAPFQSIITKAGTYTFCTWIKPSAVLDIQCIFQNSPASADRCGMQIYASKIRHGYWDGAAYSGVSGTITSAVWSFIRGINNGGVLSIYINEVLQAGTVAVSSLGSEPAYLYLGLDEYGTSDYTGVMGEVLVHNRVLSVGEGSQIYLATKWRYS